LQLDPTLTTQLPPHDTFGENPPNAHPHKNIRLSTFKNTKWVIYIPLFKKIEVKIG
jgi:hypothetical protein